MLEMAKAIQGVMGKEYVPIALRDAQLFRLPELNKPVREDKAALLNQAVRKLWPDEAYDICSQAGREAAMRIMEQHITERAATMLSKMSRATGAWLLAKTARQNAWMFSGSCEFFVESESLFVLHANPVVFGETSSTMVCHFHAALFEKLFSTLIHLRLVCDEIACTA